MPSEVLPALPPYAADRPFWQALSRNQFCIQRCAQCRTWMWPPQPRCGACGSWKTEWPSVPMRGEVHSFTHTRHAFTAETAGKTPYVNLLVTLPDAGGARLLGLLSGPEDGLEIGACVTGFVDHPDQGTGLPTLRWRLAAKEAR